VVADVPLLSVGYPGIDPLAGRHPKRRGDVESAERPELSAVLRMEDVPLAGVEVTLSQAAYWSSPSPARFSVRLTPAMRPRPRSLNPGHDVST
jgi:hypothetical protein